MQEMSGWVKLHRKTLLNPVIMKDGDHIAIWAYCLMSAVHSPTNIVFEGQRFVLQPGQFTTGRKKMAEDCKINESKVERILKLFKSEQQIEQRTDRQCRLITIKNWNMYQKNEQRNEQQVNNDRTTSEQRVNTNKEYKNIKNEKNILFADANLKKNLGKFLKQFYKKEVIVNMKVLGYLEKWPEKIIKLALSNSTCINEFKFIECLNFYNDRESKRAKEAAQD